MPEKSLKVWDDAYRCLISVKGDLERESGSELSISETLTWLMAWLKLTGGTKELGKVLSEYENDSDPYPFGASEPDPEDPDRWSYLVYDYVNALEHYGANPCPKSKSKKGEGE